MTPSPEPAGFSKGAGARKRADVSSAPSSSSSATSRTQGDGAASPRTPLESGRGASHRQVLAHEPAVCPQPGRHAWSATPGRTAGETHDGVPAEPARAYHRRTSRRWPPHDHRFHRRPQPLHEDQALAASLPVTIHRRGGLIRRHAALQDLLRQVAGCGSGPSSGWIPRSADQDCPGKVRCCASSGAGRRLLTRGGPRDAVGATSVGWLVRGVTLEGPCLAPPSRAKHMPGPTPPRHATPSRGCSGPSRPRSATRQLAAASFTPRPARWSPSRR